MVVRAVSLSRRVLEINGGVCLPPLQALRCGFCAKIASQTMTPHPASLVLVCASPFSRVLDRSHTLRTARQ